MNRLNVPLLASLHNVKFDKPFAFPLAGKQFFLRFPDVNTGVRFICLCRVFPTYLPPAFPIGFIQVWVGENTLKSNIV